MRRSDQHEVEQAEPRALPSPWTAWASLVVLGCLAAETISTRTWLHADTRSVAELAPFWVFLAWLASGKKGRPAAFGTMAACVSVTAEMFIVYAT